MEVMAETPPPLPPKTKKPFGAQEEDPKPINGTSISILHRNDNGFPRTADSEERISGPRIITWGETKKPEVTPPTEDLYENVSGGVNYLENRLKNIAADGGKRKTPKIEVRQEENKTVVKISIKEAVTPEDGFENVYENGCFRFEEGGEEYENVKVAGEGERCYENLSEGCYENVESGEGFYANVSENVVGHGRPPKKELTTEANYGNLNGDDSKCDQVYSNCEIQVSKSNVVSIIGKNSSLPVTGSFKRDEDELYENVKSEESFKKSEKVEGKKSETFLQKPEYDDNSSGDPFDSGTCSDVDSLPNSAQNRKVIVTIKSLNEEKVEEKKIESGHKRAESLTSSGLGVDSEESDDEKSNISCDSLNSNDPYPSNSEDHGYHTPNSEDKTGSPIDRIEYENVIDKGDIIQQVANVSQKMKNMRRESNSGVYTAKLIEPSDLEEYENVYVFEQPPKSYKKKPPPPPPADESKKSLPRSLLRDIQSRNVRLCSAYPSGEKQEEGKVANAVLDLEAGKRQQKQLMVEERTYEERKSVKMNKICAMEVDTDKFYKFHLAENVRDGGKEENGNEEETFAGVKDYLCREKPAAITSAKGTIRGVKNRVKAGIATFLQMHENKSYKDRDAGKVVVYTTTMGIVRETYHKCLKVKQILRTLMVKFEERDVFMSPEAQEEIRDRMKCNAILVPQVFVEGQHIGDAETIERLNEMGELRTILKPYKSADACSTCKVCGGYRLLPCSVCKGSKKSIHRNHFTAEFVALKCMNCDQVGLTKCYAC